MSFFADETKFHAQSIKILVENHTPYPMLGTDLGAPRAFLAGPRALSMGCDYNQGYSSADFLEFELNLVPIFLKFY